MVDKKVIITESQKLQLLGLLTVAKEYMKIVDACEKAADEILQVDEDNMGSLFGDAIFGGREFDEVIRYMVEKVVPDEPIEEK